MRNLEKAVEELAAAGYVSPCTITVTHQPTVTITNHKAGTSSILGGLLGPCTLGLILVRLRRRRHIGSKLLATRHNNKGET